MPFESPADFSPRSTRFWDLTLGFHWVAWGVWWWLMPGGFPWTHPRFWVNRVAPILIAAVVALGLRALHRQNAARTAAVLTAVPAFWSGALAMAWLLFPISAWRFAAPGVMAVVVLWAAWWWFNPSSQRPLWRQHGVWISALLLGAFVSWSQRGDVPSTRPINEPAPILPFASAPAEWDRAIQRGGVTLIPASASVTIAGDGATIEVEPMLQFQSRSPDRCWTLLAPRADRVGPRRRIVGGHWLEHEAALRYADDATHVLRVRWDDAKRCDLESFSQIDSPIYSHLNAYCIVVVRGRGELNLTFSPSGETPVAVPASDYPVGRPARLAYLGADGVFRVVEAHSGEKGPFRTLAEGPLAPGGELSISVLDRGGRVARLTFADWAAQTSRALSPTAGWGLPQNAVEFRRLDETGAAIGLWLTLAGTSVGRGYDSVGHGPGTYRNRLRIETAADERK